ncbi:MAG: hypothetical protein NC218_00805 [Acetobacter sp.]|nr:hypothetical protein [Acetobacter sp.]
MSYVKISDERFIVDLMYARLDNMCGRAIYQEIGWGNVAVVHQDLWERLRLLIPVLKRNDMKMKIFDAYRPPVAHRKMREIISIDGFFAETPERSQHCSGTAVDVCLCDENGREFSYPTKVDAFDCRLRAQVLAGDVAAFREHLKKARQDFVSGMYEKEIKNRDFLRQVMAEIGLEPICSEWWHYNLPKNGISEYLPIDLQVEMFI